jgi:hypothetical protein
MLICQRVAVFRKLPCSYFVQAHSFAPSWTISADCRLLVFLLHLLPVQAAAAGAVADGEYVFAEHNPFLGDPAAYEKGKDLFKRGLLSEAALALEAEVGVGHLPPFLALHP